MIRREVVVHCDGKPSSTPCKIVHRVVRTGSNRLPTRAAWDSAEQKGWVRFWGKHLCPSCTVLVRHLVTAKAAAE